MSSPTLKNKLYEEVEILAEGGGGEVKKIFVSSENKFYALKSIKILEEQYVQKEDLDAAIEEYRILKMGIPNVLRSYGSYWNKEDSIFMFTTDLMKCDLKELVRKEGPMSLENFFPIFKDIVTGSFSLQFSSIN